MRLEVKEIIGEGPGGAGDEVLYTKPAKEAPGLALRGEPVPGHQHIGTEHLLLGLTREEESVAARILTEQGAHLDISRRHVTMILVDQPARPEPMMQDIKDVPDRLPQPRGNGQRMRRTK